MTLRRLLAAFDFHIYRSFVWETRLNSPRERLVVVVPWLEGGGAQAALVALVRRIADKETVLVVCFRGSRNFDKAVEVFGEVVWLRQRKSPIGVIRAAQDIKQILLPHDTLYSLMRGSHLVLGVLPKKILREMSVAVSFHQLPTVDAVGWRGRIENLFVRRAALAADLVTTPSTRAITELISARLARKDRAVVDYNLVDVPTSALAPERQRPLNEVRLLFAGRLDKQKGLDRIEALFRVSSIPITLRIAGSGPELEVARSLARMEWPHTVDLLGYVDDLTEHIDWADYVFMPSVFELNPVVIWEAWARGRGVIGSRIPAFEDLSTRGPIHLFEDPRSFATIICSVAVDGDDHHARSQLATRAHATDSTLLKFLDAPRKRT